MPQWIDRLFRPKVYKANLFKQRRDEDLQMMMYVERRMRNVNTKFMPLDFSSRAEIPQHHITDYQSYVLDGFNRNALVYACIMYKVRAITAAPLRAYEGTRDQPEVLPADNDLTKLLDRPNTYQSQPEFQGLNEAYLNIDGNSFVMIDRDPKTGLPIGLHPLRPDRVWIIALQNYDIITAKKRGNNVMDTWRRPMTRYERKAYGQLVRSKNGFAKVGYIYTPEGVLPGDTERAVRIPAQDMMHVKLPNLLDPLEGMGYGLSPLSAAAYNVDMDNDITLYFSELIDKMRKTMDGILNFSMPLDEEVMGRIKERWQELYGGEVGVTDADGEYQRIMLSPEEMDLDLIDQRNESRIAMVFGVPLILVGARLGLLRSTYENYREARKAFWEDTMVPELGWFEQEYNYYLGQPDSGYFIRFDYSQIPAFEDIRADRQAALLEGWDASAVTMNEYRRAAGLSELPNGDVLKVNLQTIMQPVFEELPDDEAGAVEATEDDTDRAKTRQIKRLDHEQKEMLWKQRDAVAIEYEPILQDAALEGFKNDRRAVMQIIMRAKKKARQAKQTINWEATSQELRDYFLNESGDEWAGIFIPQLEGLVTAQANLTSLAYGFAFDVTNLFAGDWLNDYTMTFADEIAQTSSSLINEIIQEAQVRGWSIPQTMESIDTLFKRWIGKADCEADDLSEAAFFACKRLTTNRLELIARDQTLRASNAGTRRLYDVWREDGVDITGHEWLTTLDGRERGAKPTDNFNHRAANGQQRPIDTPFTVSGERLMYPGDESMGASLGNIIQCRCQELVLFADEFP